ncbi:hypothetical protein [Celerinatantimonas yamalensis]|uniref:Uncharacterized protein n=1 Tax=Celerinatantimonas yamalensis TaxID=559956 RepID=A0ABW9G2Q9_9GAMM
MAKRNRSTLKNYFRQGAMPSADHFADLIDSCVNQIEEGFAKPPDSGLQLTALDRAHLLSFYQQSSPDTPLWHIGFAKQQDNLQITAEQHRNKAANLTLTGDGYMGIQTDHPQCALDVNGLIAAHGRMGHQMLDAEIPADGQWHDLTPELEGCQMFEIAAGVGIRHSGRYALLHAIAINTCAPNRWWNRLWQRKNPIQVTQGYFRSSSDKLRLRWKQTIKEGAIRPYVLQIRSNTSYGDQRVIRYHLTQLWQDAYMQSCETHVSSELDD